MRWNENLCGEVKCDRCGERFECDGPTDARHIDSEPDRHNCDLCCVRQRAEAAESRAAELERELAEWKEWRDKPLPEDAEIDAAFPTRTKKHNIYFEARRLVSARHSKGELVALVNWLLHLRARCGKCNKPVERERVCYVQPTCYACLPPPEPLPIREVKR